MVNLVIKGSKEMELRRIRFVYVDSICLTPERTIIERVTHIRLL